MGLLCTNLARTLSSANNISVLADLSHGTPKIILPNFTSGDATRKVIFVAPNSREFSNLFLFIINSLIVMTPNIASLTKPVLLSMLRVEPIFFMSRLLKPKSFKQLKLINDAWAPVTLIVWETFFPLHTILVKYLIK